MTGVRPLWGKCFRCGVTRALYRHRSIRDELLRLACKDCWSSATVLEEAGFAVEWLPGCTKEPPPVEGGLW